MPHFARGGRAHPCARMAAVLPCCRRWGRDALVACPAVTARRSPRLRHSKKTALALARVAELNR